MIPKNVIDMPMQWKRISGLSADRADSTIGGRRSAGLWSLLVSHRQRPTVGSGVQTLDPKAPGSEWPFAV